MRKKFSILKLKSALDAVLSYFYLVCPKWLMRLWHQGCVISWSVQFCFIFYHMAAFTILTEEILREDWGETIMDAAVFCVFLFFYDCLTYLFSWFITHAISHSQSCLFYGCQAFHINVLCCVTVPPSLCWLCHSGFVCPSHDISCLP